MNLFLTETKKYKNFDISFLLDRKAFIPLDISFALRHAEPNAKKQDLLFLCALSSVLREGHAFLTIDTDNKTLSPSSKDLCPTEFYQYFCSFPTAIKNVLFIQKENVLFFKPTFEEQHQLYEKLDVLANAKPMLSPIPLNSSTKLLTQEQRTILETSISSCLTFICGGPGTGKSFLATHILQTLAATDLVKNIVVGTPTGKAASLLKQNLSQTLFQKISVKTIHKLIHEIKKDLIPHPDFILIDEGSMVTTGMLLSLLKGIKGYSNFANQKFCSSLIILGDPNQLPPIGIGSGRPLKEWITRYKKNTFYLTEIKRTKNSFIQQLSSSVLKKTFIPSQPLPNLEQAVDIISNLFLEKLSNKALFNNDSSFCVLTPLRQGVWGSLNLNTLVARKIKLANPSIPVPIMIMDSFPSLDLYNGDVGMLDPVSKKVFFSYRAPIHIKSIPRYSFNYALSIHKSQGSEFEQVLLLIPKGSEKFDLSLIYTGITRAKSTVEIWADPTSWELLFQK
ncbi:AAA family ATPase [Chlamydiifrater phoenicopteri]|uniref:AAA family ATPase n=1 Tax=Chlamydiifrater phoenicopteri TaxID=2681469 RepID=UPI001BCC3485|nr:AAA family ATPase [Chlamydiifrater phoenicopteri]